MDLTLHSGSPALNLSGYSPFPCAENSFPSNGVARGTPFQKNASRVLSTPATLRSDEVAIQQQRHLNATPMSYYEQAVPVPVAATPYRHGDGSVELPRPQVQAQVVSAGTMIAATNDPFKHGSQQCPFWVAGRKKELRGRIGLEPNAKIQEVFDHARKPALHIAKAAGRKGTKLTCSKCALVAVSKGLVTSDGDDRTTALRLGLMEFLKGREAQF